MNSGQTIFSQLLDYLPIHEFRKCVNRYDGNRDTRTFSCFDQLLCMAFAQLTYRDSLRDIFSCLHFHRDKIYHSGFRGHLSRSTLADANQRRDWRIYADFANVLIGQARELYAHDPFGLDLEQTVYAFDSTTIDLCLKLFPWAQFRRHKSAVKLHTLIDLRGNIPCFIHVSEGSVPDMKVLDMLPIEPGSFYVMDRGYIDFRRLYRFTQRMAFFVTRAKCDMDYTVRELRLVDKFTGLRCDQTIQLCGPKTSGLYPAPLRRISYFAADIQKRLVFITNNFQLEAITVAKVYKCRWQVELFFKWIKQNLRIEAFYGTSENAVKTQVWIAVSVYVLVAIVKKKLELSDRSMADILQNLSIGIFEKTDLLQAFSKTMKNVDTRVIHKQLPLIRF